MSTDPSLLVYLPVSIGEAVDKWNILHIKKDHVKDESRLHFVQQEIEALGPNLKLILSKPSMSKLYQYLDYFNRKIWILCDVLRVADVNTYNTYDEAYAKNCVDIIKYNDARFRVKNQMNLVAISSLREQKNFAGTKIVIWFPQTIEYHRAMVGLVRYFSFCYDKVLLCVDKNCVEQITYLYTDNSNIELMMVDDEKNSLNDIKKNDSSRVLISSSLPEKIYEECELDYKTIQTVFGEK